MRHPLLGLALVASLPLALSCGGADGKPVAPTPVPTPMPAPEPQPIPAPEPPGLVTGIQLVERGDDFIVLAWDGVEGSTGYRGHVYPAGTPPAERPPLVEVVEPSLRADGLGPGRYGFHVQAVTKNSVGSAFGDWSFYGPFVSFYETGTPRECTDERDKALHYTRGRRGVVREWDGTPFRLDFIDNFPACWDHAYLGDLLVTIDRLASRIEDQIGYRVIEAGSIVEPPSGWDHGNSKNPISPRRKPGQILAFFYPFVHPDNHGAAAPVWDGVFYFRRTKEGISPVIPCESENWYTARVTAHELFHVLGFRHRPPRFDPTSGGVEMSPVLDGPRYSSDPPDLAAYEDIDALRCIFPENP